MVAKWYSPQFRQTYLAWKDMQHRCYDPKHVSYKYYGAKGIQVCDEWRLPYPLGFENFLKEVRLRPSSGLTLDRIDNEKNYEPGNIRWATRTTQQNNRSSVKYVLHPTSGLRVRASELAAELGISYQLLCYRMRRDGTWDV